jgi:hypothetical protein
VDMLEEGLNYVNAVNINVIFLGICWGRILDGH